MDNVDKSKAPHDIAKIINIQKQDGLIRASAIIAFLLLTIVGVLALVVYTFPGNFLRYAMIASVDEMQMKLERERTLPKEQYEELKIYLYSLKKFVIQNTVDRNLLDRVRPVAEAFKIALKDGQVGRTEIGVIRAAVWQSNIPLDISQTKMRMNTTSGKPETSK